MPNIAFATHSKQPEIEADDQPLAEELHKLGYRCTGVPWNAAVDWTDFDGVLIRSTWDYHRSPRAFEAWIQSLENIGLPVWNPAATLRWNMHKGYLIELEAAGVPIIPTQLVKAGESVGVADVLLKRTWERAVLKPANSLGGDDTILISKDETAKGQDLAERILTERDLLIQRYQPQIINDGEWSLIFIDGVYCNAMLKRPPEGDFRAQDYLGASFDIEMPPDYLIESAALALERCGKEWAYARVDGVIDEGKFLLMELELLEPTLFFVDFPEVAQRLAKRIDIDLKL